MEITSVKIRKLYPQDHKVKAIASIIIDGVFAVHDIKVIDGVNGLFLAMPSRSMSEGGYRDIAHPINTETRNIILDAILEEYHNARAQEEAASTSDAEESKEEYSAESAI